MSNPEEVRTIQENFLLSKWHLNRKLKVITNEGWVQWGNPLEKRPSSGGSGHKFKNIKSLLLMIIFDNK